MLSSGLVYAVVKGLNDPQQELPQIWGPAGPLPRPLALHQIRKMRSVDAADGDFR